MKEVRWVIQNNLIAENDLQEIQNTCRDIGVEFKNVKIKPFSPKLPKIPIDEKLNIYYGSTTFMDNVLSSLPSKGLFYDRNTFSMENYINKWGKHMLNSDAMILEVYDVMYKDVWEDKEENVFIRPDGDGKEFDGQVMKFSEVHDYLMRHLEYESKLHIASKVVLGPAYNIHKEWRNYVVNGEIVTSSLYRENFKLKKSNTDIPQSMLDFANDRIKEYQPHDNFAIDIASTHDGTYYIIECGCLNSVGFYKCDIGKLVKSITKYMQENG